jgi:hypothetical protein
MVNMSKQKCDCVKKHLHKEDVCHVEFPGVMLAAELGGLLEDHLNHGVVLEVPVDLSLCRECACQYSVLLVSG